MAHISRDNWNGGYKVTGVAADVNAALDARQNRADWNRIGNDFANIPGTVVKQAAGDMLALGAGGILLGAGMVKNRKFRYVVQAILHVPMTFFIALVVMAAMAAPDSGLAPLGWACLISIVWTGLYVSLRTVPKWRRLNRELFAASIPQPPPPPRFAAGNNPY